jgi:hypothetical protein
MDIKNLELTEQDFQLLVDGLDALPEKGLAGDMMGDLIVGMLGRDNEEGMDKIKREREEKRRIQDLAKQAMKEDIRILQGKLLLLKRWLLQAGALKQANDILELP